MHRPTLRRSLCSWIAVLSLLAACSDDPAGDASQDASDDVASDAAGDTDASLADGDLSDSSDVGDDTEGPDAADADDTAPDSGDDGLAVGSACTDDAQCSGASPWCIDGQLAPLAALESSQSTAAASLASLGVVPFPEGYCSNVAPCTADADCGTGGTCFQPLIDVDADAFAGIVGALGLEPGGDEEALVLGFREYGQCLYACETDADCARPGYTCDVPLGDFLAITSTIGGRLETYCVGEAIDQCEALTCEQGECVVGPEGIATCDCDTGWSGDACDVPFDCGAPEAVDPPLSVATDDGTTLDAVATYACAEGYELVGTAERTCGAEGWEGDVPMCSPIAPTCDETTCGENGTCDDTTGAIVCTCDEGYSGDACETLFDCGDPGAVDAPLSVDLSGGTTFGAVAGYACSEGFELEGDAARTCTLDGWSGTEPTCAAVIGPCDVDPCNGNGTCLSTGDVFDGCDCDPGWTGDACDARLDCGAITPADPWLDISYAANGEGEDTGQGAVATFACAEGYQRLGSPASTTCTDAGAWSPAGQPRCEIVDCGMPEVAEPLRALVDGPTTFGATAEYVCSAGFALDGDAEGTCGADGLWSGERSCVAITCAPYTPADDALTVLNPDDTAFGDVVTFACGEGLELDGGTAVRCGASPTGEGEWTGTEPGCTAPPVVCEADTCAATGTCIEVGGVFDRCECDTGYTGPRCGSLVECGLPPASIGASSVLVDSSGTAYGATANYACAVGYEGGLETHTCGDDGAWAGDPLNCTIVTCDADAAAGLGPGVYRVDDGLNVYGTDASMGCDETLGYVLEDGSGMVRTCGADGMWTGAVSCVLYDCGAPEAGINADLSAPSTMFDDEATYTCRAGYVAAEGYDDPHVITCAIDGWGGTPDGAPLACDPVDCGDPGMPGDGSTEVGATTLGSSVTWACDDGYVAIGATSATCGADGSWTEAPPTCSLVDCGAPTAPTNGGVTVSTTTAGSTATYTCNAGLVPNGPTETTCGTDGSWSPGPPACEAYYCDVVYAATGTFQVSNAPASCGNVTNSIGTNASSPSLSGGATTPFTPAAFPRGFVRLRFPSDGANPIAGDVELIEYFMPLEFNVDSCPLTNVVTNVDHSVGLLAMSGTPLTIPVSPTLSRGCTSWGSGTVSSTSLSWDTCDVVPTGDVSWSHDDAQDTGTVTGCAQRMSGWGAVSCSGGFCGFVPGTGNQRTTWTQWMPTFTFSGTDYRTATFTSPSFDVPEGTSESNTRTRMQITSATPVHVECGVVSALTCNEQ